VKILTLFNHYLERGGEAYAVEAINDSLSNKFPVETCEFFSADWVGRHSTMRWRHALWMLRNPQSVRKLSEYHRRFRPDVWLAHNVFPVGSAAIYTEAERLGVPIVQYLHNFRPFSVNGSLWIDNRVEAGGLSKNFWPEIYHGAWQHSRLKTAWLAIVLLSLHFLHRWRSVKAWIAISDFMRGKFIEAGIPERNIFTLRHFWRVQWECRQSDGNHYLYLGRLIEAKGVLSLLDAWEILEGELSAAPPLLIAGTGPLAREIAARAERMKSVRFMGELQKDRKTEAIRNARALIVPSLWWEPLGLVVYEAYDYFRPVLGAASGGLPEIVIDGQTGLLHQPGNAEEIAQHVRRLEGDDHVRREMGQRGRAWLEQNASETLWQEKFREITGHALAQRQ
jgi:glycosyltransferase involved in cell wall biosynthesis